MIARYESERWRKEKEWLQSEIKLRSWEYRTGQRDCQLVARRHSAQLRHVKPTMSTNPCQRLHAVGIEVPNCCESKFSQVIWLNLPLTLLRTLSSCERGDASIDGCWHECDGVEDVGDDGGESETDPKVV